MKKLGFIPTSYETKSLIEIKICVKFARGNEVMVKYNPENFQKAFLLDNDAK